MIEAIRAYAHARRAVSRNRRNVKHEPETLLLPELLAADDVMLHVGASDGRHSFVMSNASPQGRIFAFEPNGFSYRVLRHAMRMQDMSRVSAYHMAVTETPGSVTLTVPVKTSGRMGRAFGVIGAAATRSETGSSVARQETVPATSIDSFVAQNGIARVDFLRMDIEGAEAPALRGAVRTLDRDLPNALIEIHPVSLRENFGTDSEAIVQVFLTRGYRMFGLDAGGALKETRTYDWDGPWKDYFFIHPTRIPRLPLGVFKRLMAA